ncbi:MAG: replication initiator, partial [Acidimicrobiales bacterium]
MEPSDTDPTLRRHPGELIAGFDPEVVAQIVHRAGSRDFEAWWAAASTAGFCANPVHLATSLAGLGRTEVLTRCKNRRASVCPSCSALYAGDTWQLVHAGIAGGHHGMPASIAAHPMAFVTLTAPSFGPVHSTGHPPGEQRVCQPAGTKRCCDHWRSRCAAVHELTDPLVGQAICVHCYDYVGHVLFSWHLPQLWHRFAIGLRRSIARRLSSSGDDPKAVRLSYVKVVEMQRRGIPHIHAVIRLDGAGAPSEPGQPPTSVLSAVDLAALALRTASRVRLKVSGPDGGELALGFGSQTDAQPMYGPSAGGESLAVQRKLAAYLAKYVTKSVAECGLGTRPMSARSIPELEVTDHVRRILETIVELARQPEYRPMLGWLHTLGYRGHITSKTRRYSTTMGALREARRAWRAGGDDPAMSEEGLEWHFSGYGHAGPGDRLLVVSAAAGGEGARYRPQYPLPAARAGGDRVGKDRRTPSYLPNRTGYLRR